MEIEDPFGYDPNDLPIDAMADGLESVTASILQATSRSEPIAVAA